MTTANPFRREPASRNRAALTNRVRRVLRTGRRKTAACRRAEQKNLRGRNRPAINANQENQNDLGWIQNLSFLIFKQTSAI